MDFPQEGEQIETFIKVQTTILYYYSKSLVFANINISDLKVVM